MLDLVRAKQKSMLIKIAFGLIILSFVIGYTMLTAPSDSGSGPAGNVAASVGGEDISVENYRRAYSNLYNLYQNIYQGNFTALEQQLNLPLQALSQLINEELLLQEADNLGLDVEKEELVNSIAAIDAFKVEGQFNRDHYLEVLQYQRLTPDQFEASQRRQLLIGKLRDSLQKDISITEPEIETAFHEENDKVSLDTVWLTPALVENKVKVEEEALKAYFEEHINEFEIAEKVALRYLQFDPARYEDQVTTFNDEDLDRYYRRNLDLFEVKEEVKAAHILLRLEQDADQETVEKRRKLAQDIIDQLNNGASFEELAKVHSDDKSNAAKGGSLGTFGRGVMVKEFEDSAFALKAGQISDIVRTPFGLHIIRVDEHTEPGVKPMVDVIDTVKAGLKIEKARQLAYEKAIDAYNINRKTGDLETAAETNDLGIKETGFFARGEAIDGIGRNEEISNAAFTLKENELARPVQTTQGVFVFGLKERKESRLPELDEVKAAVEVAFRAEQAETLAKDLADKLLAAATKENSLTAAAKELDLKLEKSNEFSRSFGGYIPGIGSVPELSAEAFELSAEKPVAAKVYELGSRFLVAGLNSATTADFSTLDESTKSQLENRLLEEKKNQLIQDKIIDLMKDTKIKIYDPELEAQYKAGSQVQ